MFNRTYTSIHLMCLVQFECSLHCLLFSRSRHDFGSVRAVIILLVDKSQPKIPQVLPCNGSHLMFLLYPLLWNTPGLMRDHLSLNGLDLEVGLVVSSSAFPPSESENVLDFPLEGFSFPLLLLPGHSGKAHLSTPRPSVTLTSCSHWHHRHWFQIQLWTYHCPA